MRILIFEDNDILRSILKDLLEQLEYEVLTFSNPGLCPAYGPVMHNCPLDEARPDVNICPNRIGTYERAEAERMLSKI
jgi:CheY-like chemotaxis protein